MVVRVDVVETDRLVMRRWRADDRDAFAAMNIDPDVMRYLPGSLSQIQSDAFVDQVEARFAEAGVGFWALELRATGALSLAVMARLGMELVGEVDHPALPDGGLRPHVVYRISRQNWVTRQPTPMA